MNRSELDALAEHYRLNRPAIEAALDLTHSQPSRDEILQFVIRLARLAGLLSLAAGIVFFIAANWSAFEVSGRFVLIELLLVASVVLALYKPPPQAIGRYASLMAFVLSGVL